MRRSAAPSQLGNVPKRPKFTPPFANNSQQVNVTKPAGNGLPTVSKAATTVTSKPRPTEPTPSHRSLTDLLDLISSKPAEQNNTTPTQSQLSDEQCTSNSVASNESSEIVISDATYFNVVWCKNSAKKHKKWEGDAVLILHGRKAVLKDMDGKVIGQACGYKKSELTNLDEGSTLVIGGKQIEIMGVIPRDQYQSGRCFLSSSVPMETPVNIPLPSTEVVRKIFKTPLTEGNRVNKSNREFNNVRNIKPYFDVNKPGALVLPRPDVMFGKSVSDTVIIDVVVDPHLSSQLRPHQIEGIIFLYECIMGFRKYNGQGAILADEMGLGKTLQCISLIWTLYKQGPYGGKPVVKRTLIITPSSLVKNWVKEFHKWLGKERLNVFSVDQNTKPKDFQKFPLIPVMIISYEMFVRYFEDMCKTKFDLVICDEGHRLKNITNKTSTSLSQLDCDKRIVLTGTPIQNDLKEFHAIVDFVNPGVLGNQASFKRIYEDPIVSAQRTDASVEEQELGRDRGEELNHLISLFTLRRTQEIINKYLPPKVETIVFCKTSPLQHTLYNNLVGSKYVNECLCLTGDATLHLGLIMAMKKLANHPSLVHRSTQTKEISKDELSVYSTLTNSFPVDYKPLEYPEVDSGKLKVVAALLWHLHNNDRKEKIVLVSHYTQTLNMLAALCSSHSYKYLRLDGSTPTAQRLTLVDRFNYPGNTTEFVFLLSSKAGGVGLNLIGASRIVLYDIDWNPANDLQAMSRVWRDGQKRTVYIYRLLSTGTIDEKIYLRQIMKQGLTGSVVDITSTEKKVKFTKDELKDIFTFHPNTSSLTHDLLNCSCLEEGSEIVEETIEEEREEEGRSCQLGGGGGGPGGVKSALRNLSMADLISWKHYDRSGYQDAIQDVGVGLAEENISFVFQTTSNMKTASQENTISQ